MMTFKEIADEARAIHINSENPEAWPALLVNLAERCDELEGQVKAIEKESSKTANIASCLANGIRPD